MRSADSSIVGPDATIRQTMQVMTLSRLQIALVAGPDKRLLGTCTDGDIRRGILRNVTLETPVREIMNPSPMVARDSDTHAAIYQRMRRHNILQMPILDRNGVIQGISLLADPRADQESRVPVVLMAGGLGRRLRPLTDTCPKPMLRLGGRPLLERIIERFVEQGFRDFHISVNYLGHQIEEYFGRGERLGCSISYIRERRQLGTAGALSLLPADLEGPFVVMNGDLLTEVDFRALVQAHQQTGYAATMCVRESATTVPFGVVEIAEGGRFRAIVEKPTLVHHVNAGIYCLSREALYVVPNDRFYDMPSLFQDLDLQGRTCGVHKVGGLLLDIGTPAEFDRAQDMFRTGEDSLAMVPQTEVARSDVARPAA